ncbi:BON domain-containing protein [Pseudodesulfovibrio sp. S3]|nr:BON domain-containing protein [Pseudodesulfovibrio sp. S3]
MTCKLFHMASALMVAAILTGCAVYPVVQVAGGAMTGYDAVMLADDYLPRNSVEGGDLCIVQDRMMERRLRERLQANGLAVAAHVIDGKAYLVGQMKSRKQADHAVQVAATVQGIKSITCKFYPASTVRNAARDAARDELLIKALTERFTETKRLQGADLRVEMVRTHAVLIGRARNFHQKTAALAIASEVGGISEVTDYITVATSPVPPVQSPPGDARVASK